MGLYPYFSIYFIVSLKLSPWRFLEDANVTSRMCSLSSICPHPRYQLTTLSQVRETVAI